MNWEDKSEFEITKNVAISLHCVKRKKIVEWTTKYHGRFFIRENGSYVVMVIKQLTYQEFLTLLSEYAQGLEFGKLHVIPEHYLPHEDCMLTINKE
jgi:hypothetical protein